MTAVIRTQVLVVGAGPVGAFTAYALARHGVDVLLVEAASGCHEDMRASTIHPPTLDMMAEVDLFDDLDAQGLRAPVFQYRNRASDEVLDFDMGELADASAHPFRLQCEQYKLARLATSRIADRVRFGERLIHFEQDDDGVTAVCERALDVVRYRADYLVATDGANSLVRKLLGVDFSGFTYPERFLTLSTAYPIDRHFDQLERVAYVADQAEWCVLLRVPEFWRVLVPVGAGQSDEDVVASTNKDRIFAGLLGVTDEVVATAHRTLYRVHQRVAERYDHGRVVLAGDAAHLNNPLGGFGMNSGIHDAWNLVDKLVRITRDAEAPEPLLAHYDRQRRTIMHEFVQAQTMANRDEMVDADQRQAKLAAVLADPAARRAYLLRQSMYEARGREAQIA